MTDLHYASLTSAAGAVARGDVSSIELTRACLARAHQLNGTLNCFLRIEDEAALEQAHRADAARAAGAALGALHGVPIAVKDMFYDTTRAAGSGSKIRHGFIAATTSTALSRLNAAGAVNLGSLHMTEFALGPTGHNLFHGPCRNPWNPAYIAAGSSSGSGSAVASRLAFGALGSDTGGSVRLPAAVNGVLGLKPTYGLVPRSGVMPLAWSVDHVGPLARTAPDLARLLGVVAGHDPADPTSSRRSVPDYEAATHHASVIGLRIGVPRNFYFDNVEPEIQGALDAALAALAAAGAELVAVDVPTPEHLTELSRVLVYSEAAAIHGHWLRTRPDDYSPQVRARAATGVAIPASAYLEALQLRPGLLRSFCDTTLTACDVLATPSIAVEVPSIADTDVGASPAMWKLIARLVQCTAPFNFLGVPALNVPAGFTSSGLPVGLQLVGRPFAESTLLRVAAAYQATTSWHERRPAVS